MEIKLIEKDKKRLKFELVGRTHTLANVLSKELWNDKDIAVAGYTVEHPLVSNAVMVVETEKGDPKKALVSAIARLKGENKELLSAIKKLK